MAGSTTITETALAGLQIQTSLLGQPIPIGWGRTRVSCNLIDYVGFKAIPKTTKSGGKGGGVTSTTYTYTASIIMSLAEGPIQGVRTIYRDSSVMTNGSTTALAQAGLSLAVGSLTQAAWGYMTSLYPTHALGYSSLAYVYAQDYPLGNGASLPNHGFEVDFAVQEPGLPDADPSEIITDFLTNVSYGVTGWTAGLIGDFSDWSLYCRACNLLLSPLLDSSSSGSGFLRRISEQTNSDFFWSEGLLKVKPYGDSVMSANSVSWTPNLTPIYDLTEDDFLREVQLEIINQSDAYNYTQLEYLDRLNQYQPAVATAQDLDNIVNFGLRKQDVEQFHDICDANIAQQVVQLRLQRKLYIRDRYVFDLPEDFVGIEPMDYVTLSTSVDGMVLNRQLVIIEQIDENPDGTLSMTAMGVPGQTASAAQYASHSSGGYQPAVDVDPGNVISPILFNAPTSLSTQTHEVWCAACGGANWGGAEVWISVDDISYSRVGTISSPARYGQLTATLPLVADPDNTSTLSVDIVSTEVTIAPVTTAEADAGATLCLVGGIEILSYANASLTSPTNYNLSYLRRGQRGTPVVAHSSGAQFIRLDESIFKFAYDPENSSSTIYVKFRSFNYYGRGLQDIEGLVPYTISLAPLTSLPLTPVGLTTSGGGSTWTGNVLSVLCQASNRATYYTFDFYKSDGTTFIRSIISTTPTANYTSAMSIGDGQQRAYKVQAKASNDSGSSSYSSFISVTNDAPLGVASPAVAGGTTSANATCTASPSSDLGGYIMFYSSTAGFDPATSGGTALSGVNSIYVYGVPAGTYYCRIAAYDAWSSNPNFLNMSPEMSFVISTGGGSTPTGGGITGGGYDGYCVEETSMILLANPYRTGPGKEIQARFVRSGDWVWTNHEHLMTWGAFNVSHVVRAVAETKVCWLPGWRKPIRATSNHRFRLFSGLLGRHAPWVKAKFFGADGGLRTVVKITVDDAHTYISDGVLSHNIKQIL
jgi:hypothetical protein